jgi:hypothetical protein
VQGERLRAGLAPGPKHANDSHNEAPMRERMKKLLNVTQPQSQNDNAHNEPALATTGSGSARTFLSPSASKFLWPFRFAPSRLPLSRKPNRKQK